MPKALQRSSDSNGNRNNMPHIRVFHIYDATNAGNWSGKLMNWAIVVHAQHHQVQPQLIVPSEELAVGETHDN